MAVLRYSKIDALRCSTTLEELQVTLDASISETSRQTRQQLIDDAVRKVGRTVDTYRVPAFRLCCGLQAAQGSFQAPTLATGRLELFFFCSIIPPCISLVAAYAQITVITVLVEE